MSLVRNSAHKWRNVEQGGTNEPVEAMKICTVQFDRGLGADYAELLSVFRRSVAKQMPGVVMDEIILGDIPKDYSHNWVYQANTVKLEAWVKYLEQTNEDIILADCDMLATGDAAQAFAENPDFDVAFTGSLDRKTTPINGGIVFARPTEAARSFFRAWLAANKLLYDNPTLHAKYRARWSGINQAALGYLMNKGYPDCRIQFLPLQRWNNTDSFWHAIDGSTVFVHYKGDLRTAVLARQKPHGPMKIAMELWYNMAGITEDQCTTQKPRIPNRYP